MPSAVRTPSIPPPPLTSSFDLGEEPVPLSTRLMPSRPMPEASGAPPEESTDPEDRTPNRPSNALGPGLNDGPQDRKRSDA
jgi:hypothetical protein